ncbi:hypothetical protein [Photobacterium kasasachensis]|uniref:hypothetical protein n=1 Tax=Photobacterium kasasachensis TaxID=2910240 RepID=UPI003D0FFDD3
MKVTSLKDLDKYDYSILGIGVLLYILIYAVSVISRVESVEFMGIDAHSIVDSLNTITTYPYYNMGDSYHSKYYGWTYLSLNFVVLMFSKLFGLVNEESFNIIVRLNLFVIGMLLTITLYTLSRHFFSRTISACTVLYFLIDPVSSHYFLTIHPESIGLLLQCVGLIVLLDLSRSKAFSFKKFIFAVILFSLSSLAKQPFFIVNVSIGLVFFAWLYRDAGYNLQVKDIVKLMICSIVAFLVTFFIIHPYAFLDYSSFIKAQSELSSGHSSVEIAEALNTWFNELSNSIVFCLNLLILFSLLFVRRVHWVYICSVTITLLIVSLFVYKSRMFISLVYLYPLYIFAIFNIVYFFHIVANKISNKTVKQVSLYIVVFFILCNATSNLTYSVFSAHYRFLTDGLGTKYITWNYIKSLDENVAVAYSPDVAMPEPYKSNGCHAWQGCADYVNLSDFKPDVVIFSPEYPHYNFSEYEKFANRDEYKLVKMVKPDFSLDSYNCTNSSRISVTEILKDNSFVLNFLNIQNLIKSSMECVDSYSLMLNNYNTNSISGLPKYIYIKND